MKKEVRNVRGKFQFLLGMKDGECYWLEQASWDCDWYWGLGYVESYRGHGRADRSWSSHQHFDGLFLKPAKFVDGYKEFFDEQPFTDEEIWTLLELMQSAYIARKYAEMLYTGGAHTAFNPARDYIMNGAEYDRINKKVIPSIMNEVYRLMKSDAYENKEVYHEIVH